MPKQAISQIQFRLNKLAQIGIYGVALQFVLGTVVSIWNIPPSEETATQKSPLFASISFDLHMLLALTLIVFSIYVLTVAIKAGVKKFKSIAIACLGSVVVATLGGSSIFYAPDAWVGVGLFIMGLGFLGAFFHYFRLLMNTK